MMQQQELITQLLTILVQLIVVFAGGFVISYLKTKVSAEQLSQYYTIAKTVVTSVEQTLGAGNGADKKEEARQALKILTKNKLSDEQIDRLIEAAVYEMNSLLKIHGLKTD